jgi:hypothetical protein
MMPKAKVILHGIQKEPAPRDWKIGRNWRIPLKRKKMFIILLNW